MNSNPSSNSSSDPSSAPRPGPDGPQLVALVPLRFHRGKETREEFATRVTRQFLHALRTRVAQQWVAELQALSDVQERIDRVADDLQSGQRRYRFIETETLATLLELDLHDPGGWARTFLARPAKLEESGSAHPCAGNLGLLEGRIPDERFALLSAEAELIQATEAGPDLRLTPAEREQLQEAYAEAHPRGSEVTLARTALRSRSGFDLEFEVAIGAGGEVFQAWSPYELAQGGGFDITGYLPVD